MAKESYELLTRKEAADFLRVTAKTMATWFCKGIGPKAVKMGGNVRYLKSDLEAHIVKHRVSRWDLEAVK